MEGKHLVVRINREKKLIAFYMNGRRVFWMHLERWERLKQEVDGKVARSHRF